MNHSVALNFEDGVTRFVFVKPNETIADAAYRERINIPVDCRDGACGTCKSHCESGTYDNNGYLEEALSAEETSKGYCLPCQMRPTSDCVLQIPASSSVCKIQLRQIQSTIDDLKFPSPSTISLEMRLTPEDVAALKFLPGQYAHIANTGYVCAKEPIRSVRHPEVVRGEVLDLSYTGRSYEYLPHTRKSESGSLPGLVGPYGNFYLRPMERQVLCWPVVRDSHLFYPCLQISLR